MTKNKNLIRDKIIKGMELTHQKLIQSKKERNLDLVISDKGRVIRVKAKNL